MNMLKQKKEELARDERGSAVMQEYQTAVTMKTNEWVGGRGENDGRETRNEV